MPLNEFSAFLRRAAYAAAICGLLLAAGGCASHTAPADAGDETVIRPQPATGDASYWYLVFLDQFQQVRRISATEPETPENWERVRALQHTAGEAIDKVIAERPEAQLYAEKAALYSNMKQLGEARDVLKAGLEQFPADRNLNLSLANTYLLEQRYDAAVLTLEDYLRKQPDDDVARERTAQVLQDGGDYARALDIVKGIPASRRSLEAQFLEARSKGRLGQRKSALKILRRVVDKDPDFLEAWGELAYQLELDKDYARALDAYQAMVDRGEDRDDLLLRMVDLNIKLNDLDHALELALSGPQTRGFLLDAASLFLDAGFPAQASTVLDVLGDQQPVPPEYYFYKAVVAFEGERDMPKALSFLEKVPAESQHYSRALQFRAQVLFELGRRDEAFKVLEQGEAKYPADSRFPLIQARLLLGEDKPAEAESVLKGGLERSPDDTALLYQLGLVLEKSKGVEEARKVMERVIALDPNNADALNFVGYTLADENHDLDRALVLVKSALRQEPENGYIIDSLAWVLYRQKHYDDAFVQIARSVELVGEDPTIWEHYGDIAKALGRKGEARKGYENALKFGAANTGRVHGKLDALR